MTSELTDRARQALEGVTAGPWLVANEIDGVRAGRPTTVKAAYHLAPLVSSLRVVTVDQTRAHFGSTRDTSGQDEANIAFIAAARTLVPELADRVDQLEAENERLRTDVELYEEWSNGLARHVPEEFDDDVAQEAIISRWVTFMVAEVERLRAGRRIETVEELDALPLWSVVRDADYRTCERWSGGWAVPFTGFCTPKLPALVLWTPGADHA